MLTSDAAISELFSYYTVGMHMEMILDMYDQSDLDDQLNTNTSNLTGLEIRIDILISTLRNRGDVTEMYITGINDSQSSLNIICRTHSSSLLVDIA